jgi:hypothetical protein
METLAIPRPKGGSFEEVWLMFKETRDSLKETERILNEKFQESRESLKETERVLNEKFQETDKQIQETNKQIKQTSKKVKELTDKIDDTEKRWGKFVESLVEGNLLKLLNEKNIEVQYTMLRQKRKVNGIDYEIDIIAENGIDIVAVEVKTTLRPAYVENFLNKLEKFKEVFPKYKDNNLMGAVAYISVYGASDSMAENNGLFVIKATGEGARLTNKKSFKPKYW